jgi:hypothetical protein
VFELLIENFSSSTAWYQTLKIKRIKIAIAQTSQLIRLALSTMKIKKIKITIDNALVELLQNLPVTLYIKKIRLTAVWHELYRLVQSVVIKKISFTMVIRQLMRIPIATMVIKKIKIIANATVAIFYTLSYWDASLLTDLDSKNLSEMDYNTA